MHKTMPELITELKAHGIIFEDGLNDDEIKNVEAAIGANLPPDLKEFYQLGLPVSSPSRGGGFPAWRADPKGTADERRHFIEGMFEFDIEHGYWHKDFGQKPAALADAQRQAIDYLRTLPPLINLYSHRFMMTLPCERGNPVISFHGPHDTIYYGKDLCDYLMEEFGLTPSNERHGSKQYPQLAKWDGIFFDAWRSGEFI